MSDDDLSKPQKKALGLVRLIRFLQRKPRSLEELIEELGHKERSVYDYLDEVELLGKHEFFNFDLDRSNGKYYIPESKPPTIRNVDAVVIHAALRMMAHHSPGDSKLYREALAKIAQSLPPALRPIAWQSIEDLAQRPNQDNPRGLANNDNLEKITDAWLKRHPINFDYKHPSYGKMQVELEVYLIEISRANMSVYVIGKDLRNTTNIHYLDRLRVYKLDRMNRIQVNKDTTYDIPDDFKPQEHLSSAWGIVTSQNPIKVKLRFAPQAAYRIREGGYPNLKEVGQLEDGYILVEIEVGTDSDGFPLELLPWIQSWGPRVEVIEPESLRTAWLAEARALLNQFDPKSLMTPKQYWAHTHKDRSKWQTMLEHSTEVSRLAIEKAHYFGDQTKAELAGILHDIGKYGDLFQRRLEGKESGLDHWSAGAHIALFDYRQIDVALAIQGHHIGLQSGAKQSLMEMKLETLAAKHPLDLRLSETNLELLKERLVSDGVSLPEISKERLSTASSAASMLETRMLFSCLVDADFLDTERTMNQGNPKFVPRPKTPEVQAARALELLEAKIAELGQDLSIPAKTRQLRRTLADACQQAAQHSSRLFTLTAPTGTGKTLAMLRFALTKAAQDPRIRRIVVVLPFLTILDQTVGIYRKLFAELGEHYILEHHSLAGIRDKDSISDQQSELDKQKRLLTENWDAPIVITTSVQLLESLHANRTSACRKLHNLAGSVVLFDEVQTLPVKLAVPTLKTLSRLASEKYGCTVVFSTATQPAFDTLHLEVAKGEPADSGWQPREIVSNQAELFEQAKRVNTVWEVQAPLEWEELSKRLEQDSQTLVIVNLKRHAYALAAKAQEAGLEGLYHLSTALCPQHRRHLLKQIIADLETQKPCRVIATQCVEAGVDLDFPKVYRALAPLDAIAQAAGRCNRHDSRVEKGILTVFLPEEEKYPTKAYQQAAELTRSQLGDTGSLDLDDPDTYRHYYQSLYNLTATSDKELEDSITTQNFADFAARYRLIDSNAVNVVVPYNDEAKTLMQEARQEGISGDWMRRVRGYTVSAFIDPKKETPSFLEPLFYRFGKRDEAATDWFLCYEQNPVTFESYYDSMFGLVPKEGGM